MSVYACLGNDAAAIRDAFLIRLHSKLEDMRIKVMILEFLTVAVETQPGLIELFLNLEVKDGSDGSKVYREWSQGWLPDGAAVVAAVGLKPALLPCRNSAWASGAVSTLCWSSSTHSHRTDTGAHPCCIAQLLPSYMPCGRTVGTVPCWSSEPSRSASGLGPLLAVGRTAHL